MGMLLLLYILKRYQNKKINKNNKTIAHKNKNNFKIKVMFKLIIYKNW